MCTRFARESLLKTIMRHFQIEDPGFPIEPQYNIAPTDPALVIIKKDGESQLHKFHFGLIPHWAKDPKIAFSCLNARSETITEKPSFRESFKSRRCLIIADGFFEWLKEGKTKRPFYFTRKDGEPLALAGIWDTWIKNPHPPYSTFSIITTHANKLLEPIHDRMPVILNPDLYSTWLSNETDSAFLTSLLRSHPDDQMKSYEVSSKMNQSTYKESDSIQPILI